MPQGSFTAQVNKWVRQTKARQEAVYRASVQRVVTVMQTPITQGGNLPFKTGFLRASLSAQIGTGLPALVARPSGIGSYSYDAAAVNLVIARATVSDTITVGYAARYAVFQEYGVRGEAGRRFVGLAAQQWKRIVAEVAAEARGRSGT